MSKRECTKMDLNAIESWEKYIASETAMEIIKEKEEKKRLIFKSLEEEKHDLYNLIGCMKSNIKSLQELNTEIKALLGGNEEEITKELEVKSKLINK